MKYLIVFLLIVAVLVTPAFAAEGESGSETEPQTNIQTVTVNEVSDPVSVSDLEYGSGLRSSFLEALEGIFGEYQPRTYSVVTYFSDGTSVTTTQVVPGVAGMDWAWISAVVLFGLFLFCLMRFLGGAVK